MRNRILAFGFLLTLIFLVSYAESVGEDTPQSPFSIYFESDKIIGIEFQEASLADFCEIDMGTNECTSVIIEVIFGHAVMKYDPSQHLSKNPDPKYSEQSYPFPLFIIDDKIYIGSIAGAYRPPSNTANIVIREPSASTSQSGGGWSGAINFLESLGENTTNNRPYGPDDPLESGDTWEEWEQTKLILPEGLSFKNFVLFKEKNKAENVVHEETILEDGGIQIDTSADYSWSINPEIFYVADLELSESFNETIFDREMIVYPIISKSSKKYELVQVKNTVSGLEVKK